MNFYYAKLKKVNNGIMVFNSEEARDKWVAFDDDFSKACDEPKKYFLEREPITEEQAIELGGRELIKKENYHPSKLEKMIAIHWNWLKEIKH